MKTRLHAAVWATALAILSTASGAWAQSAPATLPRTAAGLTAPAPAQAAITPTAQVAGQSLKLNGKGVRYRALIKVYEIGIYASAPANSLDQYLAAPGAKRLQLVTLRELTGDTLGLAMVQGMQDNAPAAERVKLLGHMNHLSRVFNEEPKVVAGSVLTIDLIPGKGTVMTLNGVQKGEFIADPLFFPAAARIWLGPKPVDYMLKDTLLGVDSKRPDAG